MRHKFPKGAFAISFIEGMEAITFYAPWVDVIPPYHQVRCEYDKRRHCWYWFEKRESDGS